jgi:hypothetical protein
MPKLLDFTIAAAASFSWAYHASDVQKKYTGIGMYSCQGLSEELLNLGKHTNALIVSADPGMCEWYDAICAQPTAPNLVLLVRQPNDAAKKFSQEKMVPNVFGNLPAINYNWAAPWQAAFDYAILLNHADQIPAEVRQNVGLLLAGENGLDLPKRLDEILNSDARNGTEQIDTQHHRQALAFVRETLAEYRR